MDKQISPVSHLIETSTNSAAAAATATSSNSLSVVSRLQHQVVLRDSAVSEAQKVREQFVEKSIGAVEALRLQRTADEQDFRRQQELGELAASPKSRVKRLREELETAEHEIALLHGEQRDIDRRVKRRRLRNRAQVDSARQLADRLSVIGTNSDLANLRRVYSACQESGQRLISTAERVEEPVSLPPLANIEPSLIDVADSGDPELSASDAEQDTGLRQSPETADAPKKVSVHELLHEVFVPSVGSAKLIELLPRRLSDPNAIAVTDGGFATAERPVVLKMARVASLANGEQIVQFVIFHCAHNAIGVGMSIFAQLQSSDPRSGTLCVSWWPAPALSWPRHVPATTHQAVLSGIDNGTEFTFVTVQDMLADESDKVRGVAETVVELNAAYASDGGCSLSLEPNWAENKWRWRLPLEYHGSVRHEASCHMQGKAVAFRGERDAHSGRMRAASYLFIEELTGQMCWVPFSMNRLREAQTKSLPRVNSTQECTCRASFFTRFTSHLCTSQPDGSGTTAMLDFARIDKARLCTIGMSNALVVGGGGDGDSDQRVTGAQIVQQALLDESARNAEQSAWRRLFQLDASATVFKQALVDLGNYMPPPPANCVPYVGISKVHGYATVDEDGDLELPVASEPLLGEPEQDNNVMFIPLDGKDDPQPLVTKKTLDGRSCKTCKIEGLNSRTHYKPNHGNNRLPLTQAQYRRWYLSLVAERGQEFAAKLVRTSVRVVK